MVGLYEVRPDQSLVPVASNIALAMAESAAPKVHEALRRIHMPSPPGSRWVGGQSVMSAGWCVAPVRASAPDPPARLRERRSRGRLALELAGLCLGLSDKLATAGGDPTASQDAYRKYAEQLGALDPVVAAQLEAPRAAVSRLGSTIREFASLHPAFRALVLKDLEATERALEETTSVLGRSQDRARGVLAPSGDFDLMPIVQSVVDAERGGAATRGATIEVEALGAVAPVTGDAQELRQVLTLLVHSAVLSLAGRAGTVGLTVAAVGPVVRVTIRVPALIAESAIAAARHIVETKLGGDLSVASQPAAPATAVMLRLAARQERFPDIGRRREG